VQSKVNILESKTAAVSCVITDTVTGVA